MTDGRQTFPDVAPGDHIIFIYDDSADLFAFVIPFITAGVARGERCLYIVDSKPAEAREALAARGLKIARDAKRGAFAVVAAREFFGYPPFNASQAVEHMRRAEMDALAAGFTGLRVAGDWAWTLEPRVLDTELSEFESLLEITAGPGRLTLACLYRRDRTDPAALERLVREHGKVIASDYILLGLSALFRSLARTDLQSLAQSARARTIRKGGAYFRQGDPATEVYLLTSGLVKLVRTDAAGRSVILSLVAPMQPFGEGGLALREGVRLVSAEALEDSRALVWDRSAVLRDIMSHPAVSIGAVRVLLDRVASEVSRLDDSVLPDVRGRLARLLLRIAESVGRKTPRGTVINVPLSRRDLADMAITTPYTVSRILSEWRRLDILDAQRTRIIIREPERFAAIAEPQTLWSGADRRPRSLANRRRRGRHSRRIGAP